MNLTEKEIELIRTLQENLPLDEKPFAAVAARVGMDESEVLEKITRWKKQGVIRRFGALLAHRRAGFSANGMVVWNVADDQLQPVGEQFSKNAAVSHCYARPPFPGWPWRLYTMIHGKTRDAVETIAGELSEASGISDYKILFSTREFKKSDSRLFCEGDLT